jgi:hypothetical protein
MRTIVALTREGLARAGASWPLVVLVWGVHLALAAAAAYPFWRALSSLLGPRPGADVLRTGIRFEALADLAELRPGLLEAYVFSFVAVAALGVLVGAALTAGVLEVLRRPTARPLGQRFGRGAGRFFGRFVGVTGLVGLLAGAVVALAVVPFVVVARRYFHAGWDAARLAPLGGVVVAGLVALLALIVLDAARVQIVRADVGVLSGLRAGMAIVLHRPAAWVGTWLANATLVGAVVVLFLLFRRAVPTESAPQILAMALAQQAFVLARTGLRVALLASETALVDRLSPGSRVPEPVAAPSAAQSGPSSPLPSPE